MSPHERLAVVINLNSLPVELLPYQTLLNRVYELGLQLSPHAQAIEQVGEDVTITLIRFLSEVKRNKVAADALTNTLNRVKGPRQVNKLVRWTLEGALGSHFLTMKGLIEQITSAIALHEHEHGQDPDWEPTELSLQLWIRSRVYGNFEGLTACHWEWRAIQAGLSRAAREPTDEEREKQERYRRFELAEQEAKDKEEAKKLNITVEELRERRAKKSREEFDDKVKQVENAVKDALYHKGDTKGSGDGFYLMRNGKSVKLTEKQETELLSCMVAAAMKKLD